MELTGGCPCNVNSSLSLDCVAGYCLVERAELRLDDTDIFVVDVVAWCQPDLYALAKGMPACPLSIWALFMFSVMATTSLKRLLQVPRWSAPRCVWDTCQSFECTRETMCFYIFRGWSFIDRQVFPRHSWRGCLDWRCCSNACEDSSPTKSSWIRLLPRLCQLSHLGC